MKIQEIHKKIFDYVGTFSLIIFLFGYVAESSYYLTYSQFGLLGVGVGELVALRECWTLSFDILSCIRGEDRTAKTKVNIVLTLLIFACLVAYSTIKKTNSNNYEAAAGIMTQFLFVSCLILYRVFIK